MSNFRECTRKELQDFIRDYPGDLEVDVARMYDPPLRTYNDFARAPAWPESIVAQVVMGSVRNEEDIYYIRVKG